MEISDFEERDKFPVWVSYGTPDRRRRPVEDNAVWSVGQFAGTMYTQSSGFVSLPSLILASGSLLFVFGCNKTHTSQ